MRDDAGGLATRDDARLGVVHDRWAVCVLGAQRPVPRYM